MNYITSYYWNAGAGGRMNEDSVSLQRLCWRRKEAAFLMVCDGIGGLDCGEWASGFVAERMTRWFWERAVGILDRCLKKAPFGAAGWEKRILSGVLRQLSCLQEEMEWYEKEHDLRCGTTFTAAFVCGRRYLVIHCGDSRAYLIGKRERQLTVDHRCEGRLTKCMGDFGFQKPDIFRGRMKKGEILLLCTDGYCSVAPEGFFLESLGMDARRSLGRKAGSDAALGEKLNRIGRFLLAHGEQDNLSAAALRIVPGKQKNDGGGERR